MDVPNRKHDTAAEAVIKTASARLVGAIALDGKAGGHEVVYAVTLFEQILGQKIPLVRHKSDLPLLESLVLKSAPRQVLARRPGRLHFKQKIMEKAGCLAVDFLEAVALTGFDRIFFRRGQGYARAVGEVLKRLDKLHALHFLDKSKSISAFAAAETVPALALAVDHK